MLGAYILPVKVKVDVVFTHLPVNLSFAFTSLIAEISLLAPMFLQPAMS